MEHPTFMEDYITLQDRMTDLLSRFCVWMWGEKMIRIAMLVESRMFRGYTKKCSKPVAILFHIPNVYSFRRTSN